MENNQNTASRPMKRGRKESSGYFGKWEMNPLLKTWITPANMNHEGKMLCPFCNTTIRAHKSDMLEHTKTWKHDGNYKKAVSPEKYEEYQKALNQSIGINAPAILQNVDINSRRRKPQQRSGVKREKSVKIASNSSHTTTRQIPSMVAEAPVISTIRNVGEGTGSGAALGRTNVMNSSGLEPRPDQSSLQIFGPTNNMLIGGIPEHSNMNYQFVGAIQREGAAVNDTRQSLRFAPTASSNLYPVNSIINYNVIEEDQEPSLSGEARAIISDLEHHRFSTEDLCSIIQVATKRIAINGICEMRTFSNSGTSQTITLPVPMPLPTHTEPFFLVPTTRS